MKDMQPTMPDESWARKKEVRKETIAVYAAEMAGTDLDLDPQLEAVSRDLLFAECSKVSKTAC